MRYMSVLLKILCNLRGKRSQTKDELSELCFGVWTSYHRLLCEHQESLQKSYCTCKIIHECFRHVSPQTTLWVDWHVNSTNCSSPHVSLNKDNFLHVQFWTSTFWTMHAFSPKARTCFKRLYKPPGRKNTILIKYSLPPSLIISLR